ncbi:Polyketide synthase modules and related proteins [hydrothermal vent metagenome]|uniref:Polyketide synthase modules and related proteins n=1 Tax=hydrothermal vent metagenome TaxID=652676 RepID=A0A3B1A098_9ZZZZ
MDKETKNTIKNTTDWNALCGIVSGLQHDDLNQREIELLHRQTEKINHPVDLKIAYLSNYTIDLLAPYVSVLSCRHGMKAKSYTAPHGQYFQELLKLDSGLLEFKPDIMVLDLSIISLAPQIVNDFISLNETSLNDEIERIRSTISQLIALAKKNSNAYVLVSNFLQPNYPQAGIADLTLKQSETEWFLKLNLSLIKDLRDDNNIFLVDKNNALSRVGKANIVDNKMFYLAKMELNNVGLRELSKELIRYIIAIKGKTKKNLVLDLDNTLWGGIVGEDGVDEIKVGKGYPEGEIFYALQNYIRNLKHRGVILSLASKNNPGDAKEAFTKRTEMPLSFDDFSITRINWQPKHENLVSIADSLNIGVDSFVFLDDSPVERQLIKSTLPKVETMDLPNDPSNYLELLRSSPFFEKLFITEEDSKKIQQYSENAQRTELKDNIGDLTEFLNSLGTQVTIETAKKEHIQRIHQLFTKTNQFNVTTIRYGITEIENFMFNKKFDLFTISVKDNFGEMGMIGLALIELNNNVARIDSFILSCRAMGRQIETIIMNSIKEKYVLSQRVTKLIAKYIPTAKNMPVESFFDKQDFSLEKKSDQVKFYILLAANAKLHKNTGIKINTGE